MIKVYNFDKIKFLKNPIKVSISHDSESDRKIKFKAFPKDELSLESNFDISNYLTSIIFKNLYEEENMIGLRLIVYSFSLFLNKLLNLKNYEKITMENIRKIINFNNEFWGIKLEVRVFFYY
jgi:hypothetical protein